MASESEYNLVEMNSDDTDITDIFISYSAKDIDFAEKLARDLLSCGATVWWDKWKMTVGDSLHKKIQDGIKSSAWLGVVLSPYSVSSPWVEKELNSALMKELERNAVFVLPILYRDCEIPLFLKDKVYADFRSSYEQGFDALVERIRPRINRKILSVLMSEVSAPISAAYAGLSTEDKNLYADVLVSKLGSSSGREKVAALTALHVIRHRDLGTHLLRMAADPNDSARRCAVFLLGEIRAKYALTTVTERLSDKSRMVRDAAYGAYLKISGRKP